MTEEFLITLAKQSSYAFAAVLVAYAIFTQRNRIGRAFESRSQRHHTQAQTFAIDQLNGKLMEVLGKAITPLIELAVDQRFRDMPEFMRDKIKILGEHGANNALLAYELKVTPRYLELTARTEEQTRRLNKIEKDVTERFDKIDEGVTVRFDKIEALVIEAGKGVSRIEGRLQQS